MRWLDVVECRETQHLLRPANVGIAQQRIGIDQVDHGSVVVDDVDVLTQLLESILG